jgi:hypothetical protein
MEDDDCPLDVFKTTSEKLSLDLDFKGTGNIAIWSAKILLSMSTALR